MPSFISSAKELKAIPYAKLPINKFFYTPTYYIVYFSVNSLNPSLTKSFSFLFSICDSPSIQYWVEILYFFIFLTNSILPYFIREKKINYSYTHRILLNYKIYTPSSICFMIEKKINKTVNEINMRISTTISLRFERHVHDISSAPINLWPL